MPLPEDVEAFLAIAKPPVGALSVAEVFVIERFIQPPKTKADVAIVTRLPVDGFPFTPLLPVPTTSIEEAAPEYSPAQMSDRPLVVKVKVWLTPEETEAALRAANMETKPTVTPSVLPTGLYPVGSLVNP